MLCTYINSVIWCCSRHQDENCSAKTQQVCSSQTGSFGSISSKRCVLRFIHRKGSSSSLRGFSSSTQMFLSSFLVCLGNIHLWFQLSSGFSFFSRRVRVVSEKNIIVWTPLSLEGFYLQLFGFHLVWFLASNENLNSKIHFHWLNSSEAL